MAAVLVASPLALAVPAQASDPDPDRTLTFGTFGPVQPGGAWSESSVTVTNKADIAYEAQHLILEIGAQQTLGTDDIKVEFADGPADSWHAAPLVALDLSGQHYREGVTTDLTGAAVKVAPHATHTFKLRVKLVQSPNETLVEDLRIGAFLAPGGDPSDPTKGWTVQAPGAAVSVTGLDVAVTGLPKSIPADGKPHTFQMTIKTANKFDWHLTKASFFLWTGEGVAHPAACDAEIDVQNPADGSWHRVGLEAASDVERDVDLAAWGTGPVDDRKFTARIALGKNFKATAGSSLGFGYYPGIGPNHFWTMQPYTVAPVDGAPACVDLAAVPGASPSAGASTGATKPATATGSAPAKTSASSSASSAPLAETGSDGTGLTAAIAAGLLAVGATVVVGARRRGRRA
ncbi:hypothetical protein A6A07_37080 [Streptomyces sp. CB03911]|nr:hypothetical protein A6A07_37080 [Streptomyces sp. CB03911]